VPEKRDYYTVLGVDRGAAKDEIRRAYRRLAKKHHPDLNKENQKEAEEAFKEVSEAYEVLSDPQKRANYDRFGHAGVNFGPGGFSWSDFTRYGDIEDIFSDFFSGLFGGNFGYSRSRGSGDRSGVGGSFFDEIFGRASSTAAADRFGPTRGSDIRYDLQLELEEAAKGLERELSVEKEQTCPGCGGTGAGPGGLETCTTCAGSGQVRRTQSQGFAQFITIAACPQCGGRGTIIKTPCEQCNGRGNVRVTKRLTVKIPAGVDSGSRLRVPGEGTAGERGGPPGDLYVITHVKEHEFFKRAGTDLFAEVPISFVQAALGDELDVPTIDGTGARVKLPAGTQTGTNFRLKSRGMPDLNGHGRGNMIVRVKVVTPTKLSRKQRELLQEFATESREHDTEPGKEAAAPAAEGEGEEQKGFFSWWPKGRSRSE
jgi:molecular chaperone DnaJ